MALRNWVLKAHFNSAIQMTKASFASTPEMKKNKIVIVGGGTGGITMAAKLLKLGTVDVTVIEPAERHYYQPLWTLVGGKKKPLDVTSRPMSSVMPDRANWIKDKVMSFDPTRNIVTTEKNVNISYSYLIVALGIELAFHKIKGLPEAFDTPGVCSNYSYETVPKTPRALEEFQGGRAIFTQPINPIKCAGAPQKIMYLAEEYFNKTGKREKAEIIFNTALGAIFSSPTYAAALRKVAERKNILVNYFLNLIEVKPDSKEAVFQKLDAVGKDIVTQVFKYDMLHVTPPMLAPISLRKSILADSAGFLDLNKHTLQSTKFPNVFGIGDCANLPTSKTMAAIGAQSKVLFENLKLAFEGKDLTHKYQGYTSCPLVTGYNKCIMAEFDYDLKPLETLPIDQSKERYITYYIKKDVFPFLYWNIMMKGHWSGPETLRKILHLGLTK